MYKRKSSDKQIDEVIYKAEHDGFGLNEEELDQYMAQYPFGTSGSNPIGTIIAFMGNTPPKSYLACDGAEYDIIDYPKLARFFKDEFGSTQYFGGTGDKFKVPDLRGEFLRGTGTNGYSNGGNGANVGIHQDPTAHVQLILNQGKYFGPSHDWNDSTKQVSTNIDKQLVARATDSVPYATLAQGTDTSSEGKTELYASRPTNTSVLYCIKAEATSIEDLDDNTAFITWQEYSTEEKCVGRWINGKPLYQRTIVDDSATLTINQTLQAINLIDTTSWNIDVAISTTGIIKHWNDVANVCIPYIYHPDVNNFVFADFYYNPKNHMIQWRAVRSNGETPCTSIIVTIQYTKTTDQAGAFNVGTDTDYSLDEKIIGTWIDRKPIYRKIITKSLEGGTNASITFTLADEIQNLSSVISEKVMARPSNSLNYRISPVYDVALANLKFEYDRKASKDNITYTFTNYWAVQVEAYLVVQYTKTTD